MLTILPQKWIGIFCSWAPFKGYRTTLLSVRPSLCQNPFSRERKLNLYQILKSTALGAVNKSNF